MGHSFKIKKKIAYLYMEVLRTPSMGVLVRLTDSSDLSRNPASIRTISVQVVLRL